MAAHEEEQGAAPARRRKYSEGDYERLISAYTRGDDVSSVASVLGINPYSARNIIRRYLRDGVSAPKRRGGANNVPLNKQAILDIIRAFYNDKNHADATLEELQRHLLSEEHQHVLPLADGHPRCVSVATLCEWLNNDLFFTLKYAVPEPTARNTPALKEARRLFATWLHEIDPRRLLYFDEHGFNLWTTRKRARAPAGQQARVPVSVQKMLNCTVAACVSSTFGKIHMRSYFGGFTGNAIAEFLTEACRNWAELADEETRGAGCVVILDNCPSHTIDILEQARVAPNDYKFLPPYSPQLNIIENVFNLHKAAIRTLHFENRAQVIEIDTMPRGERTIRRRALLERFCAQGWDRIENQHVHGAWVAMNRFIPKCLALQDI